MKNTTKLFVLLAVMAASCAPKKDKYEAFADDLCVCMRPMADFQNELTKLFEAGKQDEVMGMMEKGQKIDEDGQACIAALEKKHGKIEGEEEENKAMEALRKVCPDIVALMEESAAPNMAPEDMMEDGEPVLEAPVPAGEGENEQ
ncbi:MAG: hypothetical protein HY842_08410 [Bacteroidetes bacterium]|nr:hypothetical protein [Bacteroidota bacterium]